MFTDLFNLIFPLVCKSCGESVRNRNYTVCHLCLNSIPKASTKHPLYPVWQNKLKSRFQLNWFYPFMEFDPNGVSGKIIKQLKYHQSPEIGEYLGYLLGNKIKEENLMLPKIIIPIPIHKEKEKRRGYNQSLHIALGMAQSLNIPIIERGLIRILNSESQTKKDRWARMDNAKNAFATSNNITAKEILLVDDVVTTGATLEHCVKALGTNRLYSVASLAVA